MAETKKSKEQDPKIREGNDPDGISNEPTKETARESYPKLKKEDQQYKNQEEYLEKEPSKKDEDKK